MPAGHAGSLKKRKDFLAFFFVFIEFAKLDPRERRVQIGKQIGKRRFVRVFFKRDPIAPASRHDDRSPACGDDIALFEAQNRKHAV